MESASAGASRSPRMLAPVQRVDPGRCPGPSSRAAGRVLPGDLSPPQVGHPSGVDGVLNSSCCPASLLPNTRGWELGTGCGVRGPPEASSKSCSDWACSTFTGSARCCHAALCSPDCHRVCRLIMRLSRASLIPCGDCFSFSKFHVWICVVFLHSSRVLRTEPLRSLSRQP